jgi:hypothetical protein
MNRYTHVAILLFTLVLLAGCGGCQPREAAPQTPVSAEALAQRRAYALYFATEDPAVGARELQCVQSDFNATIHQGEPQDHAAIRPRQLPLELRVEALQQLVADLACSNGTDIAHGVVLHYGLDGDLRFDVMLQVLCLTHDANADSLAYAAEEVGYTLDGSGGLVVDSLALSHWYGPGGHGERYASKVVVRHDTGGPWTAYADTVDVRATIFPYELHLSGLIAHNALGGQDLLRIVPIAEPFTRDDDGNGGYVETGFHQGAAWVPVGVDLDDAQDINAPFRNKAADLGAPCPYACPGALFTFSVKGLPKRSGC